MCLVASFISSLVTRTRGGTVWGVGSGPARIEPCGGRQAVVGAPRGDGTGRYCSNKRRKIAHNWLEEGSRYHRYGKQGRIKLFLCIDRIPGCLPAAAGPPPPFDPPTSLVGLAQPASFCHLCLPLKMLRRGILCFLKVSKRCWAGCWRTSQAAIRNKYLHLLGMILHLTRRTPASLPCYPESVVFSSSRHKGGTRLASSPWNALHTVCSPDERARAAALPRRRVLFFLVSCGIPDAAIQYTVISFSHESSFGYPDRPPIKDADWHCCLSRGGLRAPLFL